MKPKFTNEELEDIKLLAKIGNKYCEKCKTIYKK